MSMKTCSKCKLVQPVENFGLHSGRKDGHQGVCKSCRKTYSKSWYEGIKDDHIARTKQDSERRRQIARDYVYSYLKTHPCVDDGVTDPEVLDFDHVRGDKLFGISLGVIRGYSINKLQSEIDKCEIRCANCHRKKTSQERAWWRSLEE